MKTKAIALKSARCVMDSRMGVLGASRGADGRGFLLDGACVGCGEGCWENLLILAQVGSGALCR